MEVKSCVFKDVQHPKHVHPKLWPVAMGTCLFNWKLKISLMQVLIC
jgi:hypothetical protein